MRNSALLAFSLRWSLALAAPALLAADPDPMDPPGSIDGLLKGSDSVLRGQALGAEEVPGGLLHDFKVTQAIWEDPGCQRIEIFTLNPGLPDTPGLKLGEECLVGVRWIEPASPEWAKRLGTERAAQLARDTARRVGVMTADARLVTTGNEDLAGQVAAWVRAVRGSASQAAIEAAASALLDHDAAFLRRSALQVLTETTEPLAASTVESVQRSFERESLQRGNTHLLRSGLNLMALRQIESAEATVMARASRSISTAARGLSPEMARGPEQDSCLARIAFKKLQNAPTPTAERETAR